MVTAANQIQFARHPVWHFPEVRFSSDPLATSSSAETVSMITQASSLSLRDCFDRGGEMGALMRSLDWSKTPIGDVESWSPILQMMVRLILTNRQQTLIWWGERFCQIYNDAFWPALGDKHPRSMGQPASECWPEIWHIIGPLIKTPFRGGESSWMEDIFLQMNRPDFTEETHWTIAYSPVADGTVPRGRIHHDPR
jgi:hypothetical protein